MTTQKAKVRIMLDSGAFSAWKTGKQIDIDAYIAYIKYNLDHIHNYVSLDCIPGKCGIIKTQRQVDVAAKQSYQNHQYMKHRGLSPIPVFHRGESFEWLDRYVRDGECYIGLGLVGMISDASISVVRAWLDHVFSRSVSCQGTIITQFHESCIVLALHLSLL